MKRSNRYPAALSAIALAALLAPACVKTHANTTPEMPAMDVPPPPPRVVEPTETEPPAPVPLPQEPARHATPAPPRQSRSTEAPKTEAPKPEAKPPEPPPPEPPREEPKTAPTPPLQTTPTQEEGDLEKGIRGTLGRARSDLNRVDYRGLNSDARMQYDQAKRLAQQAEDALRAKNLVFARSLADKAASIAAQLAGR